MIHVVNHGNSARYRPQLDAMHADRKSVFVDRLKWDVPVVDGRFEVDAFDTDRAIYLVATTPDTSEHLGSVRLLPTNRPHLLGNVFPMLVDGEVPRGPDVYEITRLCTSPKLDGRADQNAIRERLAIALIEYALTIGIARYTMMTHLTFLPALLATGWDIEPLGLPKEIDGQMLGALQVVVRASTLQLLRKKFDLAQPVLRLELSEQG